MGRLASVLRLGAAASVALAGCAAEVDDDRALDGAEHVETAEAAATRGRCDDAKGGLCFGTSNLYFTGQFSPGWRYGHGKNERGGTVNEKDRICSPSGKCGKLTAAHYTYGTLAAFARYVKAANLSMVSLQETVTVDLDENIRQGIAARMDLLGPEWALTGDAHVLYRKDRIAIREELDIFTRSERAACAKAQAKEGPPCQLRSLSVVRFSQLRSPGRQMILVGGGMNGEADGDRSPSGYLNGWIENHRNGLPVLLGMDMNGTIEGEKGPINTNRYASLTANGYRASSAGYADHTDTALGEGGSRTQHAHTLDYLFAKGVQHEPPKKGVTRGAAAGGSDHLWIWTKIRS